MSIKHRDRQIERTKAEQTLKKYMTKTKTKSCLETYLLTNHINIHDLNLKLSKNSKVQEEEPVTVLVRK